MSCKIPLKPIPKCSKLPGLIKDLEIISGYLQDASGLKGFAEKLLRPKQADEISAALAWAQEHGEKVTVVARQTSLTGSSVPMGGLILSMEHFTQFLGIKNQCAGAQAGILLGDFQGMVEEAGWFYPPDPTSRHECSLGASVACNASGARTYKYGQTRRYVRSLSLILPTGHPLQLHRGEHIATKEPIEFIFPEGGQTSIIPPWGKNPPVKHAAGYHKDDPCYDAIDLFIGSEGTLGVITEVEVDLLPLPEKVFGLFAFWPSEAAGIQAAIAIREADRQGKLNPLCIEWFDSKALDLVRLNDPHRPIPPLAQSALFIEEACANATYEDRILSWWDFLLSSGVICNNDQDIFVAETEKQKAEFRRIRHAVPLAVNEIVAQNGMRKIGTDFAVPDAGLKTLMSAYQNWPLHLRDILSTEEKLAVLTHFIADEILPLEPLPSSEKILRLQQKCGLSRLELPESAIIETCWNRLIPFQKIETVGFGHIGQNHIHLNLLPKTEIEKRIAQVLYLKFARLAISLGGSVSGEHGIGKIKRELLHLQENDSGIETMRCIKRALDPAGILGAGNLFL